MRVVTRWNTLPGEVVYAPSLEMLRLRLVGTLRNMIQLKMSLLIVGGLN